MTPDNLNACAMEAAAAIIAGNRMIARLNVESALGQSRDDLNNWLLYAWTSDSPAGSELAVDRALELDPNNELALAGKKWLQGVQNLVVEMVEQNDAQQSSSTREEAFEEVAIDSLQASNGESKRPESEALGLEAVEPNGDDSALVEEVRNSLLKTIDSLNTEEPRSETPKADALETESEEIDLLPADKESDANVVELVAEAKTQDQSEPEDAEEQIAIQIDEISQEINNAVELKTEESLVEPDDDDDAVVDVAGSEQVIIVVDDNAAVRKLVTMALGGKGFEVVSAADGMEAMKLIDEQKPDLVISGIDMPRLGGYQLCRSIRKQPSTEHIPILLLTAKDSVIEKMRGKMAGANGSIAKPLESANLVSQVRQVLVPAAT